MQATPLGSMWNWRKKNIEVMAFQKCFERCHISRRHLAGAVRCRAVPGKVAYRGALQFYCCKHHPQHGCGPDLSTDAGVPAHPKAVTHVQARDRSPPCPGDGGADTGSRPARRRCPVPAPPRPPPPEAGQRPSSLADNDRGRPARGRGHGRSLCSTPFPVSAAARA